MSRIFFLLEDLSMKVFLEALLPRAFPGLRFLCVPHNGKGDLEKSVPRKLRAWREPGVRFVVVRDNDGADCRAIKRGLTDLCERAGRPDSLVRIATQELEAWYLGDLDALADAFARPELRELASKARFRDPDTTSQPAAAIKQLVPEFQKISAARAMGARMNRDRNRSPSFNATVAGIEALARAMPGAGEAEA